MNTKVQPQASTATPGNKEQRNLGSLADTVLNTLTSASLPAESIEQAREMLIRGMVYGAWVKAVHDLRNYSLIPAVDSVEVIVDRMYRHQSLTPLINAARELDESPAGKPGHFPWCDLGKCVTQQYIDGETYVEHTGLSITMPVPEGMDVRHDELLRAVLCAHEDFSGEPCVSFNSGGNGVLLDPGELDVVIDNLAAFLYGLRSIRAQMTAEQAEAPV
ncbi:DUF6907 domain-containing protein [Streptomyces sp. NPDC055092]